MRSGHSWSSYLSQQSSKSKSEFTEGWWEAGECQEPPCLLVSLPGPFWGWILWESENFIWRAQKAVWDHTGSVGNPWDMTTSSGKFMSKKGFGAWLKGRGQWGGRKGLETDRVGHPQGWVLDWFCISSLIILTKCRNAILILANSLIFGDMVRTENHSSQASSFVFLGKKGRGGGGIYTCKIYIY